MEKRRISEEQKKAISATMKAHFAQPGTREAVAAKTKAFWDGCVGEARARKCAHLTNPKAQAKSHEAQRTPEFRARRVAWAKAAWAGLTPEERKEKARKLREVRNRKRAERGLPPILPKPPKVKVKRGSPEFRQMMSEKIKAYWAKYHAEHPQPPKPVKPPEVEDRPALTDGERHAQRSAAHRKAVTAVPKDGGEPLRFDSALSAAEWLCKNGRTTSKTAARLLICDVIHSRRKSAFGYIWSIATSPCPDDFHP